MPAQYYAIATLAGQAKIAAAIANQGAVEITAVAAGDGNGAPVTPLETMAGLVHEVWRGAPTSVGRDPASPTQVLVQVVVPDTAAPATIRELALFTSDGQCFAVANYPATDLAASSQGAVNSIEVVIPIVIDTAANVAVSVTVNANETVRVERLGRAPFIAIDQFANAPPVNPAANALVVVGPAPSGAFAGEAHRFAQWSGVMWVTADAKLGTIVHDIATLKYFRRTAGGWAEFLANETIHVDRLGRAPFISVDSFSAAPPANPDANALVVVGPAPSGAFAGEAHRFAQWSGAMWVTADAKLGTIVHDIATLKYFRRTAGGWAEFLASETEPGLARIDTGWKSSPLYPEVLTPSRKLQITVAAGAMTVNAGQEVLWRGWRTWSSSNLTEAQRTFATIAGKVYHLRLNLLTGALSLTDVASAVYNPGGVSEAAALFDSSYDDALLALVVANAANVPAAYAFVNKAGPLVAAAQMTHVVTRYTSGNGALLCPFPRFVLNWARTPVASGMAQRAGYATTLSTIPEEAMIYFSGVLNDGWEPPSQASVTRYGVDAVGYVDLNSPVNTVVTHTFAAHVVAIAS